jgi:hypothetical protein
MGAGLWRRRRFRGAAASGRKPSPQRERRAAQTCSRHDIEEDTMAKGQLRSNKEARKPKKDRTPAPATPAPGAQVKMAGTATAEKKK